MLCDSQNDFSAYHLYSISLCACVGVCLCVCVCVQLALRSLLLEGAEFVPLFNVYFSYIYFLASWTRGRKCHESIITSLVNRFFQLNFSYLEISTVWVPSPSSWWGAVGVLATDRPHGKWRWGMSDDAGEPVWWRLSELREWCSGPL